MSKHCDSITLLHKSTFNQVATAYETRDCKHFSTSLSRNILLLHLFSPRCLNSNMDMIKSNQIKLCLYGVFHTNTQHNVDMMTTCFTKYPFLTACIIFLTTEFTFSLSFCSLLMHVDGMFLLVSLFFLLFWPSCFFMLALHSFMSSYRYYDGCIVVEWHW